MESPRIFGGGRALLPHETQLCDALGITEEEYWEFVYLIESVNGKRPKAYDLIPNIVNMPPVAIAPLSIFGVSIGFYGVVAIGVALSYVSTLLAPKPRAPKTPPSLMTEGAASAKRFAPQTGFNSVQELADLGEIIPLVFTKREVIDLNNNIQLITGGTRVNSRLVWSQLLSKGTHQQLKACFVLSNGQITTPPDFAGYAIGDLLLKNYTKAKIAVYYNGGVAPEIGSEDRNVSQDGEDANYGENRLKQANKYDEGTLVPEKDRNGAEMVDDIFSVDSDFTEGPSDKVFSGVRSPSTQTKFGTFCPMPNQMRFQLPYELILKPGSAEQSQKDDIDKKRQKIAKYFPRYAGFMRINGVQPASGIKRLELEIGDRVQYTIGDMDPESQIGADFGPWGKEDIRNSVDSDRERIDDNISLGESYMIGNCFGVCVEIPQQGIWERGNYKDFIFEITDLGSGDHSIDISSRTEGLTSANPPDQLSALQRSATATVSNNRNCDTTEIGLKSTVYKQVTGFPNVNSHPGGFSYANAKGTLHNYQRDNGNINLGGMNKYCTRYSFFRLQARKAGTEDDFETIDNGKPFAIKGRTPQPQYNFIRINHPLGQYEFRFQPYNGNDIVRFYLGNDNSIIRLLKENCELQADTYESDATGLIYQFRYTGLNINLNESDACNTEFFLGKIIDTRHTVSGLTKTSQGVIPLEGGFRYVLKETLYIRHSDDPGNKSYIFYSGWTNGGYIYMWKGENIGTSQGFPPVLQYNETTQFRGGEVRYSGWRRSYRTIERYTLEPGPAAPVATFNNVELTGGETDLPGFSRAKVQIKLYDNEVASWTVTDGGGPYRKGTTLNIPSVSGGGKTFSGLSNVVPVLGLDKDNPVDVLNDDNNEVITSIVRPWPGGSTDGSARTRSRNLRPLDAVADFISYEAEVPSHMENPEHEIVYVNEMMSNTPMPYSNLAMGGVRLNSSKEFASFTQFSAYFKEGISVRRLIDGGTGPTNLFPEIAFALLTDPQIGAGDLIGVNSVDEERMTIAAKFCRANRLFWDGVIVDEKNLREFIFQNASYCLLDFTILGGRFALYPSVPFDPVTFRIDANQRIQIKALFTDGNIKNLKASFLSPEERQNFQGFATYRKEKLNGFAEPKTLGLRVKDAKDEDPREGFDLSLFCTSFEHADTFLKYALKTRELIDHGISFQTTPQSAMHLAPGDYIRLHSEATHTSRFANGVITEEGVIQSQKEITNGTQIIFWKPGDSDVSEPTPIRINNNNLAASRFRGSVFTVPDTSTTDRVYKVESMTYAEDGLIEISGSHTPLTANKTLAILDYYNDDDEPSFHTIRE